MGEPDAVVLRDLLAYRAQHNSERLAFADGEKDLTFGALAERAGARAGALHELGVRSGDRVAIVMATGLPFVEVFWALQLMGAAPCVFNPTVPQETLRRRVELVQPKVVVTDALAREMSAASPTAPEGETGPEDLAYLQLTSGTSGAPRASMILHRNVMAYLRSARTDRMVRHDDTFVCWVPPWHDLGLVRFVLSPVYHGISCYLIEPSVRTIPEWLQTISRVAATFSAAPDFAFRAATRMVDPSSVDLSSLRYLKSGGEPVRWSTIQAFQARFGLEEVVFPGYGLGEATLGVTEHIPGEQIAVDERGNVSCGTPNLGLEVLAGGSVGSPEEIRVRGEAVFAGYFNAPDETARALREGWLHTGDSGYVDSAGRLYVLGRREGMIKRAGSLIAPRELEEAAHRVRGVRIAAAAGLSAGPHDAIVIAVEAERSWSGPSERLAADVSREIVAALGFAPRRVSVLPRGSIPRTENGKIRHARLRSLLQQDLS